MKKPVWQRTYRYMGNTNIITYIGLQKERHHILHFAPSKEELKKHKNSEKELVIKIRNCIS